MKKHLSCQGGSEKELIVISVREKRRLVIQSASVVFLLDYFFYRSLLALLPLAYVGLQYFRLERRFLLQKKREEAKEQFKELLLLVSNSQRAGYSVENAFLSAYDEMKGLFGKDSSICKMLQRICIAKENRRSLSDVWMKIGKECEIAEIQEFAKIYDIAHKKSGNVAAVMEKTAGLIVEKMETEKEIAVLISSKRLEQKIMNVMPFLIMMYIGLTSPGYFQGLYHNVMGVVIMTVCLFVYLAAYKASLKIADIRVS